MGFRRKKKDQKYVYTTGIKKQATLLYLEIMLTKLENPSLSMDKNLMKSLRDIILTDFPLGDKSNV